MRERPIVLSKYKAPAAETLQIVRNLLRSTHCIYLMIQSASSSGLPAAAGLPDDANNVPLLHRRIFPYHSRNEADIAHYLRQQISRLRCLSIHASEMLGQSDVRTVTPYRTIEHGSIGQPPKSCVGLSVTPAHDPALFVEEINKDNNDFAAIVFIGDKPIRRFDCYRAPSTELPPQYKLNRDKLYHAHIYSPEQCALEIPDDDIFESGVGIYHALFPGLADMSWTKCASLLRVGRKKYDQMVAKTYVDPKFRDDDVAGAYYMLSGHHLTSNNVSSSEKSRQICDWLEDNLQEGALGDLSSHPTVLGDMIGQVSEYHLETADVSISERAGELLGALEDIADAS